MLDAKGVMEPYREPRGRRSWFILILGVVVFAAFGGVVGYAYLHGLPGIGGEPPLIRAEAGPYRHAPSDRGGLAVPNASSSIVSVLRPTNERPRVERLLPPETTVALQPPAPPTAAPPSPAPVPAPPPADIGATAALEPDAATPAADGTPLEVPVPQAKPPSPDQLAAREPSAAIGALPQAAPTPAAPARAPAVASEPAPPPVTAAPRRLTPPAAAPEPAAPQRTARVEPAPQAAPAAPRASSSAGTYRLQLAAVRTDSGLNQAWADLRQRYPSALGAVNSQVERTDTTTGPLYRLQAGPFANREAAANACASIKASGGQCFIVGPIAP